MLDLAGAKDPSGALEQAKALGIKAYLAHGQPGETPKKVDGLKRYEEGAGADYAWIEVRGQEDIRRAVEASSHARFVVVDCTNWKIIPLENLIGEFARRDRKIYAFMKSKADIQLAFSILEKGVDGMVIPASSLGAAKEVFSAGGRQGISLVKARIKKIMDVGNGERVCIDTASELSMGEGMLIGSKASFFFLVHSETIPTQYIPTRPFRVNAGALHSYILGVDGKTRYLSELEAGDRVQLVNAAGASREAVVGRIKMERRPLVMIAADVGKDEQGTAMLQNAETIRLVRPDGTPLAVTEAKVGDEILVHLAASKARHFGGEVDEFVVER